MKVIHFYNGLGGGVQTLISHFVNNRINNNIIYEIIYVVEKSNKDKVQNILLTKPVTEKIMIYDTNWNFYYTIKKLRTLITDANAILIAHDWVELGMVSQLKICNPVISFLHGNYEYYFDLFKKHKKNVNLFLSVTEKLKDKIQNEFQNESNSVIQYSFPVPDFPFSEFNYNTIRILFIANDLNDTNKNFEFLPQINSHLLKLGLQVDWHIVGSGKSNLEISKLFDSENTCSHYYGYVLNQHLGSLYKKVNFIINCSNNEGIPVSIIESMKNGVIPIVNTWNGSAYDIIENGKTGFIVTFNRPEEFANTIYNLSKNPTILLSISNNAFNISNKRHLFLRQINEFENILNSVLYSNSHRVQKKIYGSNLDNPLIPNFFTKFIRKTLKVING